LKGLGYRHSVEVVSGPSGNVRSKIINDIRELRELTGAKSDIVGGGGRHHSGGRTLNVAVDIDSTFDIQVVGTQNSSVSAVGNIFA
jgi:hypothetical protein